MAGATSSRVAATILLFIACLGGLALFANPYPFFKDSGELTASLASAGIAHPTGFPVQHAAAGAFVGVPAGPISYRLSLLSATAVALAATVLFALAMLLVEQGVMTGARNRRPCVARAAALPAAVAAFGLVVCDTVWFHSVNVEVYTPGMALSAAILFCALLTIRTGEARWFRLFALAGGLAAGSHITCVMVFALCLPFVMFSLLRAKDEQGREIGALLVPAAGLFALGLLAILYLPVRAHQAPLRNWGDPGTFHGLLGHLTGSSIRTSFEHEMLRFDWRHVAFHTRTYLSQMWVQAGFALVPAAWGFAWLYRAGLRISATLLATVLLADACFSIFINPMAQLEKQTSTLSLFLLLALAAVGAAALVHVARNATLFRARGRTAAAVCAALLSCALLYSPATSQTAEARATRTSPMSYRYAGLALSNTPPDGILATGQDDLTGLSLYMTEVEKRRPDLLHVVKQMVCEPSFMDPLKARRKGHLAGGLLFRAIEERCGDQTKAGAVAVWADMRTVWEEVEYPLSWELSDSELDAVWAGLLAPAFPAYSVRRNPLEEPSVGDLGLSLNEFLDEWGVGRPDEATGEVVAEFERLTAALLIRRALAGDRNGKGLHATALAMLRHAREVAPEDCRLLNNLAVAEGMGGAYGEAARVAA